MAERFSLASVSLAVVVAACAVGSPPAWAVAYPDQILREALATAGSSDELPVIVSYRTTRNPAAVGASTPGRRGTVAHRSRVLRALQSAGEADGQPLADLARARGARDVQLLWIADAIAMKARPQLVGELLADDRVLQVRLDGVVDAPIAYAGDPLPAEWNISMVNAPRLWARGFRGEGVTVAILDSGVDLRHPDLAAAWRGGTNSWLDPYGQHPFPVDMNGHGTQAAGLIVGGASRGTAIGVAPGARWIAAKIFDDAGQGTESAIHLAFQWLADPDGNPTTNDAPDIVNNSWGITGPDECNSLFQVDIDTLRAAGIAVVFSGGNFGPTGSSSVSPANNAGVTSVGAVDSAMQVSAFSSRGPSACDAALFPKVAAPGEGVLTTDLSMGGHANYVLVAGTSFAAPHVAGVMALLKDAQPLATGDDLMNAVQAGAYDLEPAGPDEGTGYGVVDAVIALESLNLAVDGDGDGFRAPADCNDRDASIHPRARERRRDGIDQDCNGHDLTLDLKYAVYALDGSTLKLRVSSYLAEHASLELAGAGPMRWRPGFRDWVFDGAVPGTPLEVTIRGPEGSITFRPRPPLPRSR